MFYNLKMTHLKRLTRMDHTPSCWGLFPSHQLIERRKFSQYNLFKAGNKIVHICLVEDHRWFDNQYIVVNTINAGKNLIMGSQLRTNEWRFCSSWFHRIGFVFRANQLNTQKEPTTSYFPTQRKSRCTDFFHIFHIFYKTENQWAREPPREPPIFFTFSTFPIKHRTHEQGSHRGSNRHFSHFPHFL